MYDDPGEENMLWFFMLFELKVSESVHPTVDWLYFVFCIFKRFLNDLAFKELLICLPYLWFRFTKFFKEVFIKLFWDIYVLFFWGFWLFVYDFYLLLLIVKNTGIFYDIVYELLRALETLEEVLNDSEQLIPWLNGKVRKFLFCC